CGSPPGQPTPAGCQNQPLSDLSLLGLPNPACLLGSNSEIIVASSFLIYGLKVFAHICKVISKIQVLARKAVYQLGIRRSLEEHSPEGLLCLYRGCIRRLLKQHFTRRAAVAPTLYLPLLLLVLGCAPALTRSSQSDFLQVDGQLEEEQAYVDLISPYKTKLDSLMGQVVARGARELKKNTGESPLGNLVADMQKSYSERAFGHHIDISVVNNGGLRNSLPAGDITLGNIYELAPFENVIYLLELTGDEVEQLAQYAVKGKNLAMAGLQVEGKDGELIAFTVGGQQVVSEDRKSVV